MNFRFLAVLVALSALLAGGILYFSNCDSDDSDKVRGDAEAELGENSWRFSSSGFQDAFSMDEKFLPKPLPLKPGQRQEQLKRWMKFQELENSVAPISVPGIGGYGKGDPDKAKILLLGLDGVTWKTLTPLINMGLMPNLKKLLERSSYGWLDTDLAFSPISWTSIATGKSQQKTLGANIDSLPWETQAKGIMAKRIWAILARADGRKAPDPMPSGKGLAIIDYYFTPGQDEYTEAVLYQDMPSIQYPEGYFQFLADNRDPDRSVPESLLGTEKLVMQGGWDQMYTLIRRTDELQHDVFFNFCVLKIPQVLGKFEVVKDLEGHFESELESLIELYRRIDYLIGRISQKYPNDYLFIVSDHGFGTIQPRINFHPNPDICDAFGLSNPNDYGKEPTRVDITIEGQPAYADINWDSYYFPLLKAKAAVPGRIDCEFSMIHLTFSPADPEKLSVKDIEKWVSGILHLDDELAEAFWKVDVTDKGVEVAIREKVARAHYHTKNLTFFGLMGPGTVHGDLNFHGVNDPGIIIASGPGIERGLLMDHHILFDVTPTLLYLKGRPVGRDMDGRVLTEMINPNWLAKRPVSFIDSHDDLEFRSTREKQLRKLAPEEFEKLRSLGYIQ